MSPLETTEGRSLLFKISHAESSDAIKAALTHSKSGAEFAKVFIEDKTNQVANEALGALERNFDSSIQASVTSSQVEQLIKGLEKPEIFSRIKEYADVYMSRIGLFGRFTHDRDFRRDLDLVLQGLPTMSDRRDFLKVLNMHQTIIPSPILGFITKLQKKALPFKKEEKGGTSIGTTYGAIASKLGQYWGGDVFMTRLYLSTLNKKPSTLNEFLTFLENTLEGLKRIPEDDL